MNIVVFGAGAIGSVFGGLLSQHNDVVFIGRKQHVQQIQAQNLHITGKTNLTLHIPARTSLQGYTKKIDLLLLTVKSYDTKTSIKQILPYISSETIVLSLQNGLDNIDTITTYVPKSQVMGGITTHGAIYEKPGMIIHSGIGTTLVGECDGKQSARIKKIAQMFTKSGISTQVTTQLFNELWKKAIINSSINPLTAMFHCPNGYLKENPVLASIVEKLCIESTSVGQAEGVYCTEPEMIQKTWDVVRCTAQNQSSMLQSILQNKPTEIQSINGHIVRCGNQYNCDVSLNTILVQLFSDTWKKIIN